MNNVSHASCFDANQGPSLGGEVDEWSATRHMSYKEPPGSFQGAQPETLGNGFRRVEVGLRTLTQGQEFRPSRNFDCNLEPQSREGMGCFD
jgi:hypothetical protein